MTTLALSTAETPQTLRAALAMRSMSLRKWALRRRYKPQTVYAAVLGQRDGVLSRRIMQALRKDLHG